MISLPPPTNNRFLFLDMNAFFASCEQWRNPDLRGQSVAITPTMSNSGCVIAASYEAKRLGLTIGESVGDAKQKIPSIKIVESCPKFYVEIHNQISQFLQTEISPNVTTLSIDEFAVPLDKREQWTPNAHRVAERIKQFLADKFATFIRCSIGVGPNMFLAKLATDIQKPDGFALVQTHTIGQALGQFGLMDLPGINWAMDKRLHLLGIRTPIDFAAASQPLLRHAFGIAGVAWWHVLRGYSIGSVLPGSAFGVARQAKSMSHSHVLAPALRAKTKARTVLYKLWIKVADRLRAKSLGAGQIIMSAHSDTDRWSYGVTVLPTQNVFRVFAAIAASYDRLPESFQPKKMRVVVFDLAPHNPWQPKLLPDSELRVANVFAAVEKTNALWGRWTLKPASLLIAGDAGPNRIAFHAPDYAMD